MVRNIVIGFIGVNNHPAYSIFLSFDYVLMVLKQSFLDLVSVTKVRLKKTFCNLEFPLSVDIILFLNVNNICCCLLLLLNTK